jgi:superfamily I DNA/RNA helicase/mRNA-degrading endonuclease RelE of RelBE toxin-antitoxin system
MYEVAFTTGFRDDLRSISPQGSLLDAIQRCVDLLKTDPFQKIPNAKRLRSRKARFRMRFGDLRLLYRVENSFDRIVLFAIGYRQGIYKRDGDGGKLLPSGQPVSDLIKRAKRPTSAPTGSEGVIPVALDGIGSKIDSAATDIEVAAFTEWISEEELWLLQIPHAHWEAILHSRDAEKLPSGVPLDVRVRVESYATSPGNSQLSRVYALGDDGVGSITSRPLHEFLTALDPDQQRVIQSGLSNGPYLVRGGPGTGKSLIGLHAIAAIVKNRVSESLFAATERPRFGVLTYTNTLSGFNESLIRHIRENAGDDICIECQTLDKIVYALAKKALDRKPEPRGLDQVEGWMRRRVIPELGAAEKQLVERLGLKFVVEEIEQVIHDNDIQDCTEYLGFKRRGRGTQLKSPDREGIWAIYEIYRMLREQFRIDSWQFMRKTALHELLSSNDFPRYNALFVDEVQDLSLTSRQLILNLVRDSKFLLMTEDSAQSIYLSPPRWKQVDDALDFRGARSFILRRNYRTTKQIHAAIASLRLEGDDDMADRTPVPQFSGPRPTWLTAQGCQHTELVGKALGALNKHYPLGNMGVIVRTNQDAGEYAGALRAANIQAAVVNRDQPIDLSADAVHVITAHSAKGLEFPVVVVPDVSDQNYPGTVANGNEGSVSQEAEDAGKRLLYVALSRACQRLVMVTDEVNPSRFEHMLDPELWEHEL